MLITASHTPLTRLTHANYMPITVAQAVSAAGGDAAAVACRISENSPLYSICCMKSLQK